MSRGPEDQWRRLQMMLLQNRANGPRFNFPGGGGPRNWALAGSLLALGVGGIVVSNSLFNGILFFILGCYSS